LNATGEIGRVVETHPFEVVVTGVQWDTAKTVLKSMQRVVHDHVVRGVELPVAIEIDTEAPAVVAAEGKGISRGSVDGELPQPPHREAVSGRTRHCAIERPITRGRRGEIGRGDIGGRGRSAKFSSDELVDFGERVHRRRDGRVERGHDFSAHGNRPPGREERLRIGGPLDRPGLAASRGMSRIDNLYLAVGHRRLCADTRQTHVV
jgi:hypothetical protein